jgi:hypothetical protein
MKNKAGFFVGNTGIVEIKMTELTTKTGLEKCRGEPGSVLPMGSEEGP